MIQKATYKDCRILAELAVQIWAKGLGCTEFASDCELDNTGSLQFHIAMGFEAANRIICFRKRI